MEITMNLLVFSILFFFASISEIQGAGTVCKNDALNVEKSLQDLQNEITLFNVKCDTYQPHCIKYHGKLEKMDNLYCPIMMVRILCEHLGNNKRVMLRTLRALQCLKEG